MFFCLFRVGRNKHFVAHAVFLLPSCLTIVGAKSMLVFDPEIGPEERVVISKSGDELDRKPLCLPHAKHDW